MLRIICTRDDIKVHGVAYFEGEEVNSYPDDCWTAACRELARLQTRVGYFFKLLDH